jgi:hypothetical protein
MLFFQIRGPCQDLEMGKNNLQGREGCPAHNASELVTNLLHRGMCKEPLSCGPEDLGPLPASVAPTTVNGPLFCSI